MTKVLSTIAGMKNYLSFWLTLISVVGVLVAHFVLGTDIELLLPTILGIYITNRTAGKVSAHMASAKDPQSDTDSLIKSVDDK